MFYTYILENKDGKHYVGYTADINNRLLKHNSNSSAYTRLKGPWSLVHLEEFDNKRDAFMREKQIKKFKGGQAFKNLIRKPEPVPPLAEPR